MSAHVLARGVRFGSSPRTACIAIATLLFLACTVLPVAYLAVASLHRTSAYSALLLDPRQRALLYNTCLLGIGAAAGATAVGVPLGIALSRVRLPGTAVLRLALAAPGLLPPYIAALAWTYVGSRRGSVARATGIEWIADWTYSLPAAVVVLTLVFYPLSMLATEVALRRVDGRLEEAALMVAGPARVLWRISMPLAAPAILAAALVVFVLAISEFGVPGLLRVRVYTTEVFTAFAALYDVSRAMLLAAPLLLLAAGAAAAAARFLGNPLLTTPRPVETRTIRLDGLRAPATAAALVVVLLALGVPLIVLLGEALGAASIRAVLSGSAPAIASSLVLAAEGATAVVCIAVWLGYARARAGARAARLVDALLIASFAVPSTVTGVGLIVLWNRSGPPGWVYGTDAMLVIGYVSRFVPVAALMLAAATRYVPRSHEEAAAVSGAGWLRTFGGIVLPQMRVGIAATWAAVFVLAFGELGASILIAPPGDSTLPIRIYTLIANTPPSHIAALALFQTLVVLAPLAVLGGAISFRRAP